MSQGQESIFRDRARLSFGMRCDSRYPRIIRSDRSWSKSGWQDQPETDRVDVDSTHPANWFGIRGIDRVRRNAI